MALSITPFFKQLQLVAAAGHAHVHAVAKLLRPHYYLVQGLRMKGLRQIAVVVEEDADGVVRGSGQTPR
jgi:hypothetical protein